MSQFVAAYCRLCAVCVYSRWMWYCVRHTCFVVLRVLNSRDISCGKSGSVLTSGHGYTLQTLCIGSDVILCAAYLLSCVRWTLEIFYIVNMGVCWLLMTDTCCQHVYVCICTYTHIYVYKYIYIYIYMCIYIYIIQIYYIYIYMYMYIYVCNIHVCINIRMNMCVNIYMYVSKWVPAAVLRGKTHTHKWINIYVYI